MCTCVSHVIDGCVPGSRPVPFIVCQDDLDRGDAVPVHRRVSVCVDVRACHAMRVDTCEDICLGRCLGMCQDMRTDMCVGIYRHVA